MERYKVVEAYIAAQVKDAVAQELGDVSRYR
jgi:hypothetical protein